MKKWQSNEINLIDLDFFLVITQKGAYNGRPMQYKKAKSNQKF